MSPCLSAFDGSHYGAIDIESGRDRALRTCRDAYRAHLYFSELRVSVIRPLGRAPHIGHMPLIVRLRSFLQMIGVLAEAKVAAMIRLWNRPSPVRDEERESMCPDTSGIEAEPPPHVPFNARGISNPLKTARGHAGHHRPVLVDVREESADVALSVQSECALVTAYRSMVARVGTLIAHRDLHCRGVVRAAATTVRPLQFTRLGAPYA